MSQLVAAQRVRILFAKGEAVKYVAHLALMRAWERIVRRAGLPIAHSHGFNPRPKLTFASALPVGYTGRAEVMDIELTAVLPPAEVLSRLQAQLPPGFAAHRIWAVPVNASALQAHVCSSVYRVTLCLDQPAEVVQQALARLLAAEAAPRQREIKGRLRDYDLRALIQDLSYEGVADGCHVLGMTLVTNNTASGRPDEVLAELGFSASQRAVERVHLLFEEHESQP